MAKVVICESLLKPREIPIPSSVGDGSYYTVVAPTLFSDVVCDCKGYQFRGTCKHSALIQSTCCRYHRVAEETDTQDSVGRCPDCYSSLILYELDPEFL